MTEKQQHQILSSAIAMVWLINGLVCKVLNFVPRHRQIVAGIVGGDYAQPLTVVIGALEIAMSAWIISGIWTRVNALIQILVVVTMNILEFILVPDLLLWGRANSLFALLFILAVYYNEFHLNRKAAAQP